MRLLYCVLIAIGGAFMLYFGFYKKEVLPALLLFLFVYRPVIDMIFIKEMKLYKGKRHWTKYPFWGFSAALLSKKKK